MSDEQRQVAKRWSMTLRALQEARAEESRARAQCEAIVNDLDGLTAALRDFVGQEGITGTNARSRKLFTVDGGCVLVERVGDEPHVLYLEPEA